MPIKKIIRIPYPGLWSKCSISYFCIICISSFTTAKQTTPAYRTQPVLGKLANIAASILYSASFRSFFYAARKGYPAASFYLMATPANYTKIRKHLRVSYQAHKRHSPYSPCLPLEHKALWYRAYFEGILDLFAKALLCLDDPCMQVIFSWNKLSGNGQSTFRIVPTLPIRTWSSFNLADYE